jgi:hypothetical protein
MTADEPRFKTVISQMHGKHSRTTELTFPKAFIFLQIISDLWRVRSFGSDPVQALGGYKHSVKTENVKVKWSRYAP